MPLYEYQCDSCDARFELIRKFSDPPLLACPTCGAERVRKLISSPAFQFKGSGFYATDYARKSEESSAAAKTDAESKADSKADAKGDSKADAKGDSKADAKREAAKDTSAPAADKTSAPKPVAANLGTSEPRLRQGSGGQTGTPEPGSKDK
jgi:putative FmdB family regulatory protein